MTWCERLEVLRSVNKKPEKVKPKPIKIKFFKDKPKPVLPEAPGPLLPQTSRASLHEHKRIKNLLEEVKVKGAGQYEWLQTTNNTFQNQSIASSSSDSSNSSSSEDDDDDSKADCNSTTMPSIKGLSVSRSFEVVSPPDCIPFTRYRMPGLFVRGGGWKMAKAHTTLFN